MMIFELFPEWWFAPIIATLAWSLLIGVTAWSVVYRTSLFDRYLTANFDSAFCGILNIIFVFFMAFMGSDFYANYKSATDNLFKEKATINRLLHTQLPTDALNQKMVLAVTNYLDSVINVEWRQNLNRTESAGAQKAIASLDLIAFERTKQCTSQASNECMDLVTAASYLRTVNDLREARDYRLALGSLERQTLRYLLCMFLAFNAAVSILAFYRKDRRAAIIPLIMYCATVWIAFMIVVLHAEPYIGIRAIQPIFLEHILQGLREAQ
jgi:hypothetical protein